MTGVFFINQRGAVCLWPAYVTVCAPLNWPRVAAEKSLFDYTVNVLGSSAVKQVHHTVPAQGTLRCRP